MTLEHIDPFLSEDRFCLDHLFRYLWVSELLGEQDKILDVACGSGFGTAILGNSRASSALGIDSDAEAVENCRKDWELPNVEFRQGLIEELSQACEGPFDYVVSFETLEHLKEPEKALKEIKAVLKDGGLFVGSLPGELDWQEQNAFHLQHFDYPSLKRMLGEVFANFRIWKQCFHLSSVLDLVEQGPASGQVFRKNRRPGYYLDFGRSPEAADSYVFLASDGPLPGDIPLSQAFSRQAWYQYYEEAQKAFRELGRLSRRYKNLFAEHGELLRRFTNVLGWGSYHFEKHQGRKPDKHYLDEIVAAQSSRERELRNQVSELQKELQMLRGRLEKAEALSSQARESNKRTFFSDLGGDPKEQQSPQ